MRIALLANLRTNAPTWEGMPEEQWDDLDSPSTIETILNALREGGHEAEFFEASLLPPFNLPEKLMVYKPDLCFNMAEGHGGDSREAQIPALLEMLRIPYTGSRVMSLALALDKPMTKRILTYHGLPTPAFQVFEREDEPIDEDLLDETGELKFPVFMKPSREGTSVGVSTESVVRTVAKLREQLRFQLKRYQQPILLEQFIQGREVTVGILGNYGPTASRRLNDRTVPEELPENLHFFPILESQVPEEEAGIYTNRAKMDLIESYRYLCPAPLDAETELTLYRLAAAVFKVIGCYDVSRIDFRFDENDNDKPYILEINPLPGLTPGFSDLCLQAQAEGWSHTKLVNEIVNAAIKRHGLISSAEKQ